MFYLGRGIFHILVLVGLQEFLKTKSCVALKLCEDDCPREVLHQEFL